MKRLYLERPREKNGHLGVAFASFGMVKYTHKRIRASPKMGMGLTLPVKYKFRHGFRQNITEFVKLLGLCCILEDIGRVCSHIVSLGRIQLLV